MNILRVLATTGVALAAAATLHSTAAAAVADFEGYPTGDGTCSSGGSFDGLSISGGTFACTLGPSNYSNWPAQPASNIEVVLGGATIATTSSNPFTLVSMDLQLGTYNSNLGGSDTLTVTGNIKGGGTDTVVLTVFDPLETYEFNWGNLSSVSVSSLGGGGYTGFDNIVYNAVPEPATWAMLILGIFGVGAFVRRRGEVDFPVA